MPRALGVDFRPSDAAAEMGQVPIGVFLESRDGSMLDWKYADNIVDDADVGDPGFRTYVRTVDALGSLPGWWSTAGVQRESELGLFDSLIEAGQLWTPREWMVRRDVASYPGFRFFTVFMVADDTDIDGAYEQYVTEALPPGGGDQDLPWLPDPELIGWRPAGSDVLRFTINMLMTGVVGYRWPRNEDGEIAGEPIEIRASERLVDQIATDDVPSRAEIERLVAGGIVVEGVRIG